MSYFSPPPPHAEAKEPQCHGCIKESKKSGVGKANCVGKMWEPTAMAGEQGHRVTEAKVLKAKLTRREVRGWLHRGTLSQKTTSTNGNKGLGVMSHTCISSIQKAGASL